MENQLETLAEKLAEDYWDTHKSEMADIIAESLLEGYDELNLEEVVKRTVATSTIYTLLSRMTENVEAYFDEEDFRNVLEFNTRKSVNALGTAVSNITTEIFEEIENINLSSDFFTTFSSSIFSFSLI